MARQKGNAEMVEEYSRNRAAKIITPVVPSQQQTELNVRSDGGYGAAAGMGIAAAAFPQRPVRILNRIDDDQVEMRPNLISSRAQQSSDHRSVKAIDSVNGRR